MATRLEKIKLSGFKSFVDPTSILFPSNLIGVVGPNGCGKSNVIDAVRWVMGELSAKQLRGESSTDVIFNGSRDRKPVGQASIELVFDNSDSTLGGAQYASYSQIAIRREVSLDGQSNYYLNGTKCRRRDITDVFSGTGLGSRSYAIIEQDMISRFIEAKPEELRIYLEEVAGISKYKERRRETETRIRNTRDNLSRVDDLCKELATQLERLQRQAKAAERYKILKEEERLQKAQQLGLRWLSLDEEIGSFTTVLHERENILEARRADLQHIDTQIEKSQTVKTEFNDDYQEIQGQYYEMGSNISRIEQTIEHHKDRRNQLEMDLQQLEENWKESQTNLTADEAKLVELNQKLSDLEPQLETIRKKAEASVQTLHQAEENMQVWQAEWDEFNQKASDVARMAEVQQARIQHLEQQQTYANQRLLKIDQEKSNLSQSDSIQTDVDQLIETVDQSRQVADEKRMKLTALISKIDEQRATRQEISGQLDSMKHDLQQKRETQVSLEAVQALALGQKDDNVSIWLEQQQLTHKPRLAQQLEVEKGWEKAVEIVLGPYLEAICADNLDITDDLFGALEQGTVTVIDVHAKTTSATHQSSRLSDKVRANAAVQHWLQAVYVADTIEDALSLRPHLSAHESVVTKEGLLMGANWLRVSKGEYKTAGVIEREQELREIKHAMIAQKTLIEQATQSLVSNETVLTQLEQQRADLKDALSEAEANYAGLNAKLQMMQAQIDRLSQHHERLSEEYNEQHHQIKTSAAALVEARHSWEQATEDMERYTEIREGLLKRRDEKRDHVQTARVDAERDQHQLHDLQLHWETASTQVHALKQSIERKHNQVSGLQKRRDQLTTDLTEDDAPVEQLEQELDVALEKRAAIETALTAAKQKVDNIEAEIQIFI